LVAAGFLRPPAARALDKVHDPLVPAVASLEGRDRVNLLMDLARVSAGFDAGKARPMDTSEWGFWRDEEACRANPMSKEDEPGSPWVTWRTLARMEQGGDTCFVGALSCTDSLCGPDLVPHERLCVICADRDRAEVSLYPNEAPSIRDEPAEIDSVAIFPAGDHILLEAHLKETDYSPCGGVGGSRGSVDGYFVTLRGGRVIQAFSLDLAVWVDEENPPEGDSGWAFTTTSRVTANVVEMDFKDEDWSDTTSAGEQRVLNEAGTIRYEYNSEQGLFTRVR
jgi:hypothetical protein